MKKILFTIKPHSIIDVITNSSTELFVGKNQNKDQLIELIKEVCPNYLYDYDELKSIDELEVRELDQYFDYTCSPHCWPATKSMYPVLSGFTFDELYVAKDDKPAWNGEIQYELRDNSVKPKHKYHQAFVTDENFEELKNRIDPNRELYFLYSKDENPDWEVQDKFSEFMSRIHLG